MLVLAAAAVALSGKRPTGPPLTAMRSRIVAAAESQIGYTTNPSHSYCNKFSAFWASGTQCAQGLRSEEWCADFAAWAWRQGGAEVTYSFQQGDIDASVASFYSWAVAHGTWHPVGDGYVPRPGDVAIYGLDVTTGIAAHAAVVTGYTSGNRGPDVVNGDGDHTGFSVVEAGTDQYKADASTGPAPLSGYASPIAAGAAS